MANKANGITLGILLGYGLVGKHVVVSNSVIAVVQALLQRVSYCSSMLHRRTVIVDCIVVLWG